MNRTRAETTHPLRKKFFRILGQKYHGNLYYVDEFLLAVIVRCMTTLSVLLKDRIKKKKRLKPVRFLFYTGQVDAATSYITSQPLILSLNNFFSFPEMVRGFGVLATVIAFLGIAITIVDAVIKKDIGASVIATLFLMAGEQYNL